MSAIVLAMLVITILAMIVELAMLVVRLIHILANPISLTKEAIKAAGLQVRNTRSG